MKKEIVGLLKRKKSIAFLVIMVLLLCVGIVKLIQPLKEYSYQGSYTFEEGVAVDGQVIYADISLKPGIYEVRLEYTMEQDFGNLCFAKDATVYPGGLLTNGENMFSGKGYTGYHMWLFESTDNLQVCISYDGEGQLSTGNLTVKETRLFGSLILTIGLSLCLLFIAVVVYRSYDKAIGIGVERKKAAFGVAVIAFIASVPYLLNVTISGADFVYHLQRIEGLKDGLLSGQFPVRIEPEWVHGHGYASGIFYCNILLLLPALLRMVGVTITDSYNIFCIVLNIVTAWIAYHCFFKIFKKRSIGLACSALYTLSTFRIYKLLITAAVGEGSAVTFMPLILYGFYLVFTEETSSREFKKAWLPLAFGYAGLLQTHVLTCEITAFITILLCVAMIKKIFCKERFWMLAKAALAAIGMSLWFLVPFLDYYINEDVHIKHVSARTIQNVGLYPAQLAFHWWRQGSNSVMGDMGMQSTHPMGLGLVLVVAFFVFVIMWFSGVWNREKSCCGALGKVSAVFAGMLMLMSLNIFPWDKIQGLNQVAASLVSSLQFPNRFLGWGTTFCVVLAGCLLWYFDSSQKKWEYFIGMLCVLLGITTSSVFLLDTASKDKTYHTIYNAEGMGRGYISGAEYVIEGTEHERIFYRDAIVSDNVELQAYSKGALRATITCRNKGTELGYVDLPLLLYRGYQAKDIQTGERLAIDYGENNTVCVMIPVGFDGTIQVQYVSPWYWRFSEIISCISYILIGVWVIKKLHHDRKRVREIYAGMDEKA